MVYVSIRECGKAIWRRLCAQTSGKAKKSNNTKMKKVQSQRIVLRQPQSGGLNTKLVKLWNPCNLSTCPRVVIVVYEWVLAMVLSSLTEGFDFLLPLKEVCCQLKKPSVDPTILDNFYLLSNLCFLGKVVQKVVNPLHPSSSEETSEERGWSGFTRSLSVRIQSWVWDENSIGHAFKWALMRVEWILCLHPCPTWSLWCFQYHWP